MKRATSVAAVLLLSALGFAQTASAPVLKNPGDIDWKASGSLPPGAEYHLVYEDPKTHAVQTLVRMPKGYALPTHSHTHDETLLVLKGKLSIDFGAGAKTLSAGGYLTVPAGTPFSFKITSFGGADFLATFNGPYDFKGPDAAPKP